VLLLGSRAKHKDIDVILKQAQGLDEAGLDVVIVGAVSSIFVSNASTFQRSWKRSAQLYLDEILHLCG